MADSTKNAAPTEEYNDDGTKNPDYVAPVVASESADDTKNTVETTDEEKDESGDDEDAFDDTIDPTKPPEIPVRQSTAQHIIARKNKKIEKLQSEKTETEDTTDDDDDDQGAGDKNLTPQAQAEIHKEVQKIVAPLLGKLASDADNAEFESLITKEPEAKKYANHIKAYMAHESYKGVSPVVIYHHLAWQSALAIGAKKKAAADLEAKQNKGGGRTIADKGTVDGLPSAEDIENMSDADFARMEEDALQGKFVKK